MIRGLVESYYDIQKVRIAIENQIRASKQGVSKQEAEYAKEYFSDRLLEVEKRIAGYLKAKIKDVPIWNQWLRSVKGVGPVLAAGLISWLGDVTPRVEKVVVDGEEKEVERGFRTISKLWAYCGLAVDENGHAVKRAKGKKTNYNPRLKTHLWKIGESFVKSGNGYRKLYEQFRADYDRKWRTPEDCGSVGCRNKGRCMDAHRYAAAKRKTIKVFLAHYLMMAYKLAGLEPIRPFIIGRDGHSEEIPIIYE